MSPFVPSARPSPLRLAALLTLAALVVVDLPGAPPANAYDGRGLLRSEAQYPSWPSTAGALITTNTFDPSGNALTTLDPLGRVTTYGYDALDELTSIDYADPATPDVAYEYEPNGNRTKLIYPDGTAVTYAFDQADRLGSLADWASRQVAYTYWPDGLAKTATNPDGSIATYTYDNARRLVDILDVRSGTTIERFTYGLDPAGNVTSVANGPFDPQYARPDGLASSNGTWTGSYASINEVTPNDATFLASPTSPTTANYYEVTLSDVARPGTLTGLTVRYRYAKSGNNAGKTTNLTVELRQGSTVIASATHTNIPGATGSGWQQGTITLTPAQAASITDFADLRIRFRPSSSGGGQGRSALISWAEVQTPGPGDPASQYTYGYDRLSRLTGVSGPDGARAYAYDPLGNRLTKTDGGTTAYTYDGADRLLTAGGTAVTVDAAGNLVARGADTFGFDGANRLTAATVAGSSETYTYDGDGVRVSRQVGADPPIRSVSDVNAGLPVTLDDGTHTYVYGLGLAYAVSGSGLEVYHVDRLGSVRALTDGSGTVTATYRTDEWGVPVASSGSSSQPFGFTGEPADATGLIYLRARSYDPDLGRFVTRDALAGDSARPISLNRYSYAYGNPATLWDPSGNDPSGGGHSAMFCVELAGGISGYGVTTACLVKDDTGRRAFMVTSGSGGIAGASSGFSTGIGVGNGRIGNILGKFGNVGGSATVGTVPTPVPIGVSLGGEASCSAGCSTVVVQFQGGLAVSLEAVEVHGSATNTWIADTDLGAPAFAPVWVLLDLTLAAEDLM